LRFLERLKKDPYFLSGVSYFIYGGIYLAGALASLSPARQMSFHGIPWWTFYIGGLLLVILVPFVIFKKNRWLTILIGLGPLSKCIWLVNKQLNSEASLFQWLFLSAAGVCALLLFRAALIRQESSKLPLKKPPPALV